VGVKNKKQKQTAKFELKSIFIFIISVFCIKKERW